MRLAKVASNPTIQYDLHATATLVSSKAVLKANVRCTFIGSFLNISKEYLIITLVRRDSSIINHEKGILANGVHTVLNSERKSKISFSKDTV